MEPEQIREARRTAVAALRLETEGRREDAARLIAGSEDVLAVAVCLANLGSSLVVPLCAERRIAPAALFASWSEWFAGEDGGKPGDQMG